MSNTVIQIENLSKQYHLGVIGYGTLREDFQSWWARIRGKEDPNSKVNDSSDSKKNSSFWALDNINYNVREGDIVGIVGKNGAGKSTLLKILSRVTNPTRGSVKIKGRVASLLEIGTGFHPELTGKENIFLNGAILGMTKSEILRKYDEIVAFSEIEKFINTPVKRYSSGMYVRLAFAVAAHLESEIMVLDEVLAVGDAAFQKKCFGKVNEVSSKTGRTVLFVSHNLGAVANLCKNGILLEKGKLIKKDNINGVIERYISSHINNMAEIKYEHNNNKAMQFKRVALYNASDELATEIDRSSDLKIVAEYEVREYNEGALLGVMLDKIGVTSVFHFADIDFVPENIIKRKPGTYKFTATIPGSILNAGTYQLRFSLARYGGEVYDEDNEGIILNLSDFGSFASLGEGGRQRPGIIAMNIDCVTVEMTAGII